MSRTCRTLTEAQKKSIAARQRYRCANQPGSNIRYLENYACPLWGVEGDVKGNFDEAGYEIDHIIEFCIDQNDHPDNLQALCNSCHSVKTKKFMMLRNKKNNIDTHNRTDKNNIDTRNRTDKKNHYKRKIHRSYNENGILEYKCHLCEKIFNKKSSFDNHLKRKKPCKKIKPDDGFTCKYCNKFFTRKYNLNRHIKNAHKQKLSITIKNNKVTVESNMTNRKNREADDESDNESDDESDNESDD